ncbi:unnamed protein product [Sphenostylis stenocarpa]|uniref:Uncharacterized protein n=1 Tax=Sphenostylis stenocarpa TaxID=92480 RepID=A0AA86VIR0_9FABA|nr:unnamed protein product [Sphenostylis stenocarpa]
MKFTLVQWKATKEPAASHRKVGHGYILPKVAEKSQVTEVTRFGGESSTELSHSFLDLDLDFPHAVVNLPNLSVELTHHRIVQFFRQHYQRGSVVINHAVIHSAVQPRQHIRHEDSPLPHRYPGESNAVEIRMLQLSCFPPTTTRDGRYTGEGWIRFTPVIPMALRGVWQLNKLIVSYCDWGGSSRGIRFSELL